MMRGHLDPMVQFQCAPTNNLSIKVQKGVFLEVAVVHLAIPHWSVPFISSLHFVRGPGQ